MPFDFGPREAACFPARCAALAAKHAPVQREGRVTRALDVGCAVGGATFELAKAFTSVTGLDFSHAFVNTAKRLQARLAAQHHRLFISHATPPRAASRPASASPAPRWRRAP